MRLWLKKKKKNKQKSRNLRLKEDFNGKVLKINHLHVSKQGLANTGFIEHGAATTVGVWDLIDKKLICVSTSIYVQRKWLQKYRFFWRISFAFPRAAYILLPSLWREVCGFCERQGLAHPAKPGMTLTFWSTWQLPGPQAHATLPRALHELKTLPAELYPQPKVCD